MNHIKKFIVTGLAVLCATGASADISLEKCMELARDNYPVIKKYELLGTTEEIELSEINKSWLPHIGIYAQGTVQNTVPKFPSMLTGILQQMGSEIRGLGKFQYKVGVDINQTIWDGGISKSKREMERKRSEVNHDMLDVEMYGINKRVQSLFFGILLLETQIEQFETTEGVYSDNLARLNSMVKNGVAMQSEADIIEAQMLTLRQQITQAKSAGKGYRSMLSIFTGENLDNETLRLPEEEIPLQQTSVRPELRLFNSRLSLNNSQRKIIESSLMPKIGFFTQGYYGYPGIDYFKAMTERDPSFNILAGLKVSWNIDGFYSRNNSIRKIELYDRQIEADRETFLFNTAIECSSLKDEISGLRSLMADDGRIVELRRNVRLTAESQLRNGVIDATTLSIKINEETQALLQSAFHRIQYRQAIYNLKNILNR